MAQIVHRLGWYDYTTALVIIVLLRMSGVGEIGMWLLVFILRSKFRAAFKIPGSVIGDCIAALCCNCCAVAQMATHAKSYTEGSCSFEAPPVLPGYSHVVRTNVSAPTELPYASSGV